MEHRALGKGINALLFDKEKETDKSEKIVLLKLGQVRANPYQPREDFDLQSLEELKQSIKEKGFIQPIVVRRKGDAYELIAGERRLRAATQLSLEEIPAIVRDVTDEDSLELALIENIQRQNLNSIEEARAYNYLIEKFNLTQEKVSEIIGKSRVTVANTLRLLKLPREIQEEMRKGRISFAHGRALLEIDDEIQQKKLVQEIISKGLSLNELESLIRIHRPKIHKSKIKTHTPDHTVLVLEESLQHALATKVKIIKKKKRGHINIEFYSEEDLQRIVKKLKGA